MQSEYNTLTPHIQEVCDMYIDIKTTYAELTDVDYTGAFTLAQKALVLSDSFITLQAEAGKLAKLKEKVKE